MPSSVCFSDEHEVEGNDLSSDITVLFILFQPLRLSNVPSQLSVSQFAKARENWHARCKILWLFQGRCHSDRQRQNGR